MHKIIQELTIGCIVLNKQFSVLNGIEARNYIDTILTLFKPKQTTGHLAIQSDISEKFPTDPIEFEFSKHLEIEPVYLFFDQESREKNTVFIIDDGQCLSKLLEECFGMEYFVSNASQSYLISVNWYTLEVIGSAQKNLKGFDELSL